MYVVSGARGSCPLDPRQRDSIPLETPDGGWTFFYMYAVCIKGAQPLDTEEFF